MTFLVGENGSGKSAILEGLACAAGSIAIAGEDPSRDPTMRAARALGRRLRLTWRARTQRGFFLRAEDFFGFAKYVSSLKAGLEEELATLEAEPGPETYGRGSPAVFFSISSDNSAKPISLSIRPHTARVFWSCSNAASFPVVSISSMSRKHPYPRYGSCRCFA